MLLTEHKLMLINAAEAKDPEILDRVIKLLKIIAPNNFLSEEDMPKRVFHHQPLSRHWSGRAITTKLAYHYK
jgi:hypothetical protein